MCNYNCLRNVYKEIIIRIAFLATQPYNLKTVCITALILLLHNNNAFDAKYSLSKNAPLCQVFIDWHELHTVCGKTFRGKQNIRGETFTGTRKHLSLEKVLQST